MATDLQGGPVAFNRIAVLPFQSVSPADDATRAIRCPLCGSIFRTEPLPQGVEKVAEDIFLERFKDQKKIRVVSPERCGPVFDRITAESLKGSMTERLKKTGRELDVEGIIVGYVYRFRERKGFSYSVEKPASVAFEIHLIRVSDGVIVWKGIFDKTQQSLMENMFQISSFVKEGGQWVTARELLTEGIEALLAKYPGFQ